MANDERSLVDRAKDLGIEDAGFLRALSKTEGAAVSKSMAVVRNGDFPNWSVERWLLVAGVCLTVSTNVFDVGGRFERMENRQHQTAEEVRHVGTKVDQLQSDIVVIKVEQGRVRTELDLDTGRPNPVTPRFGPEWSAAR